MINIYIYTHANDLFLHLSNSTCGGASTGGGLRPRSSRRGDRLCRVMRWMDPVEARSGGESGVGVAGVFGVVGVFMGAETCRRKFFEQIFNVWYMVTGNWKNQLLQGGLALNYTCYCNHSLWKNPLETF